MRKDIIRETCEMRREACKAALIAHRQKYSEYCQLKKMISYKVKVQGIIYWVEITTRAKSYVASIQG